jgi:hypothetical protein
MNKTMETQYDEIKESFHEYTLNDFKNDKQFKTHVTNQDFKGEIESIKSFTYNEEYVKKIDMGSKHL